MWKVEVVEWSTDEVVKELGPYQSERVANKSMDGLDRNLDHSKFFTRVVPAQK